MHNKSKRDHLKDELEREYVTEDHSNLLKLLIVLCLILSVTVISHCHDQRVKEDSDYNDCFEEVGVRQADDKLAELRLVVKQVQ